MRFLLILMVSMPLLSVHSQTREQKTFKQAIEYYQNELQISFAYDTEVLKLISEDVYFSPSSLPDFMSKVSESFPLVITPAGDKYYTISTVESLYSISVTDFASNSRIAGELGIFILVNGQQIPTSHIEGRWSFLYKPVISDTLEVFSLGYNRRQIPFENLLNNKSLSVALSLRVVQLEGVTIEEYLTKGINLNPANQSVSISVKDLPLLPGETDGDIFSAITALPGVTTPDGRAGNLFVRGSETDQTLILFDNIPIYHRGHYYGTISPYNPKVVDNVEVFRSGYHPRLGDRVGGAVLINSDQTPVSKPVVGGGFNTLYASAYAKTALLDKRIGVSFGVRRSYPRKYQSPKLNAISESVFAGTGVSDDDGNILTEIDVLFEDYHGKVNFKMNEKNDFSLSGIYTNTKVQYAPVPPEGRIALMEENKFQNNGFNFDWRHELGNLWTSKFSATFSDYRYSFDTKNPNQNNANFVAVNDLKDVNFKQEFSKTTTADYSYQLGIDYKWQEVFTDYFNSLLIGRDPFYYSNKTKAHSISSYANLDYYGAEKWFAQLGLRTTYYDRLKNFRVAPRLLVNFNASEYLNFKASTGWYNQYLSQARNLEFGNGGFDNELWVLADKGSRQVIIGLQSMAGFVFQKNSWIADVEAYRKSAYNITVFEDRRLYLSTETFSMDQVTRGIDVLLKRKLGEAGSLWLGYSLNDSEIELDTTHHVVYTSKYVQPSVWYIGGAFNHKNVKLSASWKYSSGLNAQSLDIVYASILFDRQQGDGPPGSQPPNSPPPSNPFKGLPERYPNMHSLDVSASYKIPRTEKRRWEATFGLSLVNVFNRDNLTDRVFRGRSGFIDRRALGFSPNLMVNLEF